MYVNVNAVHRYKLEKQQLVKECLFKLAKLWCPLFNVIFITNCSSILIMDECICECVYACVPFIVFCKQVAMSHYSRT